MSSTSELATWPRPHYQPGGARPFLFYKLHGDFTDVPPVSRGAYRTRGLPDGLETFRVGRADDPELTALGVDDALGEAVEPSLRAAIRAAPHVMLVRGEPAADATLDYLRDTIGVLTALLDAGAVAMFDPQRFGWWTPAAWRQHVFAPARPQPWMHVAILSTPEPAAPDRVWIHTRGMRTFGRPDLSIHGVAAAEVPVIEELCHRFIGMAAAGVVVPEGQQVRIGALPGDWRCFHGGDVDDPEFNNVHLEIRRG